MRYFLIGVGGSGAKFIHAMLFMSAAGMMPDVGDLECLLVDADGSNGNINACQDAFAAYKACKSLMLGSTSLFRTSVSLDEKAWTPVRNNEGQKFDEFFHYAEKRKQRPVEASLMELFYPPKEREMAIGQGFRGRPAIGSAILADRVNFQDRTDRWYRLVEGIRNAANDGKVPVLFVGSVFGGTGAAGVPTIFRLLARELDAVKSKRLGLILMLPYFTFNQVISKDGKPVVQADPSTFPEATAEALQYYHERGFLKLANSMYTLGEQFPAPMPVSAVGAGEQTNPPHFLELVASLGGVRFFSGFPQGDKDHTLSIAMREREPQLHWSDLPFEEALKQKHTAALKQMILFAVLFRYVYAPWMNREAANDRKLRASTTTIVRKQVLPYIAQVNPHADEKQSGADGNKGTNNPSTVLLGDILKVNNFAEKFLDWLLGVSTSHRSGFQASLANISIFAVPANGGWRLKEVGEFSDGTLIREGLFPADSVKLNLRSILDHATEMTFHGNPPNGSGYLIRALYDACNLF